ncbi:hypothetical protein ABZ957_15485 [Streptomyces sp. NPDC046316]|uniref:hypothetical protein n=1 Tax=Streptomyces sp. NPDC046316 TaxID=3154494 RepID=UPI0033DB962B
MTDINRVDHLPADFRPLLNLERLSSWTLDRQREHTADLATYEATLATFQTALRSQHVAGDHKFAARWRARKVEKHLKTLVRTARDAAQASESLRTTYADHVRTVAALPAQREQKAMEKAARRQRGGELAAKSLNKTVEAMRPGRPEAPAEGETAGQSAVSTPGTPVRGISDLFGKQKGA